MEISSVAERLLPHLNPVRLCRDLWSQRVILFHFARRDIAQRYRGARFGVLWAFAQPLFLLCVYTLAFGIIMQLRWPESRSPSLSEYAMALYCGLAVFTILSECVSRAPALLMENRSYLKKAMFPVQVLPFCVVLAAVFHGVINLAVLTGLSSFINGFHVATLALPLVLAPLCLLTCGLTLLLSCWGVLFRDLQQMTAPVLLALFFLSPIVYSPSIVPARWGWVIRLNPLAFTITSVRDLIMWKGSLNWCELGVWTLLCFGFFMFGFAVFMRMKSPVTDRV